MGSFNVTTREIAKAIDEALDNLEGDFTDKQLQDALKRAKLYPFVCDKAKSVPKYVRAGNKLEGGR
jgi:hypothetical protein